jgi:hypothetical protein
MTPYVYYTLNTMLGAAEGPADPLQNGNTKIMGSVFVPGTSSVLFFGSTGTNYGGYGEASTYNDSVKNSKGYHSLNGEYALQVWGYNANDFAAVKQGTKQPGQLQPYDVWNFNVPIPSGEDQVGGVAYDPSTGRLYVSVVDADPGPGGYGALPLIEVYHVNIPTASSSPPPPQVGTLAATPFDSSGNPLAGAVAPGTSITLTAGNVYAPAPGDSVAQVAFYLDTNNDGVLEQGTDKLLGYGAPDTTDLNATHNYQLKISTSGLAPGTYTIFAIALDSNGVTTNVVSATFTIS